MLWPFLLASSPQLGELQTGSRSCCWVSEGYLSHDAGCLWGARPSQNSRKKAGPKPISPSGSQMDMGLWCCSPYSFSLRRGKGQPAAIAHQTLAFSVNSPSFSSVRNTNKQKNSYLFFFFTLHVLSGHSCLTTLWKLRFTLSLDPQTPGPTDSWHRHGSWCEINGRTPVWTKKLELRLFKPLVPANYQPMEVTGEKGTSSRHCKVAIDCTKTVMSALWQMTQVFQQTSNLKGEERLL